MRLLLKVFVVWPVALVLLPVIAFGLIRAKLGGGAGHAAPSQQADRLYRGADYWMTWPEGGAHSLRTGRLGEDGTLRTGLQADGLAAERAARLAEGFSPADGMSTIEVEYDLDGEWSREALNRRHALEARLDALMLRTGLGLLDGGSIGPDTMEASVTVVDAALARRLIAEDLAGTEFAGWARMTVFRPDPEAQPETYPRGAMAAAR